jgi:hypothetical protein
LILLPQSHKCLDYRCALPQSPKCWDYTCAPPHPTGWISLPIMVTQILILEWAWWSWLCTIFRGCYILRSSASGWWVHGTIMRSIDTSPSSFIDITSLIGSKNA